MIHLIKPKLEQAQNIAIFGHSRIDGDAIGAMFGLGLQLEKLGKTVSYFTPNPPDSVFDFLNLHTLQTTFDYGDYDLLTFIDFSEYKRIGDFTKEYEAHMGKKDKKIETYFNEKDKIIIDHHLNTGELPNALIYRDETAISTCELIYELTTQRRGTQGLIDSQIATLLYLGILTDSGNLRYDTENQTERILTTLLDLLKLGADKQSIINNVFRRKSYADIQFMQFVLSRMQRDENILYARYSKTEKLQFGASYETSDSDHALQIMQDIEGSDLIIMGKDDGKELRISLRGRGKYDCSAIAKHFKGGGHFNSSGCTIAST